jgi:hypothetical protein
VGKHGVAAARDDSEEDRDLQLYKPYASDIYPASA